MMATLQRKTLQRLVVLRTLSLWKKGVRGPLRLHKTLFFSDQRSYAKQRQHFFTFKKWHLGQYSNEIADALNALQSAGRIRIQFDGPSERIEAVAGKKLRDRVCKFFAKHFPHWDHALAGSFKGRAHLNYDQIFLESHEDDSYTQSAYGTVIIRSNLPTSVKIDGLSSPEAEDLTDAVDGKLSEVLRSRLRAAAKRPVRSEDWRSEYFSEDPVAV
jgi:hypothetical protein